MHAGPALYWHAFQSVQPWMRWQMHSGTVSFKVSHTGADGERSQTVGKLWELLRRMLSMLPGRSSSAAARTQALVQGARAYLAKGHEDYVMRMVQSNRAQVRWHAM